VLGEKILNGKTSPPVSMDPFQAGSREEPVIGSLKPTKKKINPKRPYVIN